MSIKSKLNYTKEEINRAKKVTGLINMCYALEQTIWFIRKHGDKQYKIKTTTDNVWDSRRSRKKEGIADSVQIRKAGRGFYGLFIYFKELKYVMQARQSGDVIDHFLTLEEAEKELQKYENDDRAEGIFEENFYEIKEIKEINED